MVGWSQRAFIGLLEHGEVHHPQEGQVLVSLGTAQFEPQPAQHLAGDPLAVGGQQQHVGRLRGEGFHQPLLLHSSQELGHR